MDIKIGTASTGRAIILKENITSEQLYQELLTYTDLEVFELSLMVEHLLLKQLRLRREEHLPRNVLVFYDNTCHQRIGELDRARVQKDLGLLTAFAVANHIRRLLDPPFR